MDYVSFFNYVNSTGEITHSGISSLLIKLNTQFPYLPLERLNALQDMEQHASYSITAYRAIEWYALLDEMTRDAPRYFVDTAKEILARVEKPTTYWTPLYGQVEVT